MSKFMVGNINNIKTVFRGFEKNQVLKLLEESEKEIQSLKQMLKEKELEIERIHMENETLKMQLEITKKIYTIHKRNRELSPNE